MNDKEINLFEINHLTKVFGGFFVLNDVSFNIRAGEIFGIIGRSGTGKTTFLNTLIGFEKPDMGEIHYRDLHLFNTQDSKSLRSVYKFRSELREVYGFAAQKPSFYPSLTVWENLMYFGALHNLSGTSLKLNAENLLNLVDLSQAKKTIAGKLSGGMQRRLDIACSLIHDPKILILDEPTADLDPVLSNKIWNILRLINQKGTTIVVASHHVVELEHLCDRIAIFKEGLLVALGDPKEIKAKNVVEESILIKTSPGRYEKLISKLKPKTRKSMLRYSIKDKTLVIETTRTNEVINDLMKVIENQKEQIIDIEFMKPNLDKIFINIDTADKMESVNDTNNSFLKKGLIKRIGGFFSSPSKPSPRKKGSIKKKVKIKSKVKTKKIPKTKIKHSNKKINKKDSSKTQVDSNKPKNNEVKKYSIVHQVRAKYGHKKSHKVSHPKKDHAGGNK